MKLNENSKVTLTVAQLKKLIKESSDSMKKYELTDETLEITTKDGRVATLHHIRALRRFGDTPRGRLGGWIEKEENLSHEGTCWVSYDAQVFDDAQVSDDATVSGDAKVYGNSQVFGGALVDSYAQVYGNARIHDSVSVGEHSQVFGDAEVSEFAVVYGNAKIYGNALVTGSGFVSEDARVFGNAKVCDHGSVMGKAVVKGDMIVDGHQKLNGGVSTPLQGFIHGTQGN